MRRVQPLDLPGLTKVTVKGERPVVEWVKPTSLLIDEIYQRDLTERSMRLVRRMLSNFAWNRMKPPIVARVNGELHVIDGQHTAITAATLRIPEIPVFVVDAPEIDERARAFVGHNTDRITVTPINIYRALLASGDPDATDVANVCRRAGVTIRQINHGSAVNVGECMAIGSIRGLVRRRGVMTARKILEVLVKAKRAPIAAAEIAAAESVICEELPRGGALDELISIIRIDGDRGFRDARARAAQERIPLWRVLRARWLSRLKRMVPA